MNLSCHRSLLAQLGLYSALLGGVYLSKDASYEKYVIPSINPPATEGTNLQELAGSLNQLASLPEIKILPEMGIPVTSSSPSVALAPPPTKTITLKPKKIKKIRARNKYKVLKIAAKAKKLPLAALKTVIDDELFEVAGYSDALNIGNWALPQVPKYEMVISQFVENDFSKLRADLNSLKAESFSLAELKHSQTASDAVAPSRKGAPFSRDDFSSKSFAYHNELALIQYKRQQALGTLFHNALLAKFPPVQPAQKVSPVVDKPEIQVAVVKKPTRAKVKQVAKAKIPAPSNSSPKLELLGKIQRLAMNEAVAAELPKNSKAPVSKNVATQSKKFLITQENAQSPTPSNTVYGLLRWDDSVAQWFKEKKGYVELSLYPVGSRNAQDTLFVDYRFPGEEFELDGSGINQNYRLVAAFYTSQSVLPVAQVQYPAVINPSSHKERIRFYLAKNELDEAVKRRAYSPSKSELFISVFEGASGDFKAHTPIAGASIEAIGLGTKLVTDEKGNAHLPTARTQSEILLKVEAPGFYPVTQVVPVFAGNTYTTVDLISKDKVDAITNVFIKKAQTPNQSLVLGRVFDPKTRQTWSNQKVQLSHHPSQALYFGAMPDLSLEATTDVGLFGFFNVLPSFRVLRREGKPGMLVPMRENSAYYVEFGRGGQRNILGQILDPFTGHHPEAEIRTVGSDQVLAYSDSTGQFKIKGVDFPPGVIVLEVSATGYPKTWFNLPFSTLQPEDTRKLYMIEEALLEQSRSLAGMNPLSTGGSLVGGAHSSFFKNKTDCLSVRLLNQKAEQVPSSTGPFLLNDPKAPVCLTQENPSFAFYNLADGEYLLQWLDSKNRILKTHVRYIGQKRLTISID